MTDEQLKASIAQVKKAMHTAQDSSETDLLGHLMSGIVGGARPSEVIADDRLMVQLDEHAVDFDTKHPTLAKALRELMDVLQKMGI